MIVIAIGNSDNKLTQMEWSDFVSEIAIEIEYIKAKIHFFGGASTWEQWQNVAWIIETKYPEELLVRVKKIREKYKQESAFVMVGDEEFI